MIVRQIEYVYVPIPDHVLMPFEVQSAGVNASGLVRGYVNNTINLGQCNRRLISIEEWQKEQERNLLDNNKNKNTEKR